MKAGRVFEKHLLIALGDLRGAVSATIITLPLSIGYGLLVFAPLGTAFAPQAACLGIYSGIICCLCTALLGGSPVRISGPGALTSLVLAGFVAEMTSNPLLTHNLFSPQNAIVGLTFCCVFVGGVFQVFLSILGVGNMTKWVPSHVISGLRNSIAILVILKQINPFLGLRADVPLIDLVSQAGTMQLIVCATAVGSLCLYVICARRTKLLPAPFGALVGGTALYQALRLFFDQALGAPVLNVLAFRWPHPGEAWKVFLSFEDVNPTWFFPQIIKAGCMLGVLGAMESLLTTAVAENLTEKAHDHNRGLIALGIGNIACSLLGATASSGSVLCTTANFKAGASTRLSGVLCSGLSAFIAVALVPMLKAIPLAVIAAVMIGTGLSLFDTGPFQAMRRLGGLRDESRGAFEFFVSLAVTGMAVSTNLVAALLLGMILTYMPFQRIGVLPKRDGSSRVKSIRKKEIVRKNPTFSRQRRRESIEIDQIQQGPFIDIPVSKAGINEKLGWIRGSC